MGAISLSPGHPSTNSWPIYKTGCASLWQSDHFAKTTSAAPATSTPSIVTSPVSWLMSLCLLIKLCVAEWALLCQLCLSRIESASGIFTVNPIPDLHNSRCPECIHQAMQSWVCSRYLYDYVGCIFGRVPSSMESCAYPQTRESLFRRVLFGMRSKVECDLEGVL